MGVGLLAVLGLRGVGIFLGLGGGGGPDPFNSPLLTYTRRGLPMHLMLDRYFLALDPALSSNSFGVSHSFPMLIHFPFDPVSYLQAYNKAVVDLHRTFITDPNFVVIPVFLLLDFSFVALLVLELLPVLPILLILLVLQAEDMQDEVVAVTDVVDLSAEVVDTTGDEHSGGLFSEQVEVTGTMG